MLDIEKLGFPEDTLIGFNELIQRPHGIILVTGPTGSGKTTTLYCALEKINSPEKKIITVEDPVEYQLRGINQIQVKPSIGLTFANALRSIVRQDPDVILIGEIRDAETAEIAIHSALTGHLVLSTLHTNDAPSAITRLIDMGMEDYLLSSTIIGILAQRLVRVACPFCREPYSPDPVILKEMKVEGQSSASLNIFEVKGCEKCSNTGYWGRAGIFEFLKITDEYPKAHSGEERFQYHQGSGPEEWDEDTERRWLVEGQTGDDHHLRSLKGDPGRGDDLSNPWQNIFTKRRPLSGQTVEGFMDGKDEENDCPEPSSTGLYPHSNHLHPREKGPSLRLSSFLPQRVG